MTSKINNMSKSAVRVGKNYIKGYTDTQVKVRDATSNDPWGPSGQQMNELAQLSYNQNDFIEIMEIMDKRLNDKGKNWRHVFKTLTLLDYLLHAGSENCVIYFRDNMYVVKTLKEFQYIDEQGKDQGGNVRQKAKDITNLLQDEARLREERRSRAHMRERMNSGGGPPPGAEGDGDAYGRRKRAEEANQRSRRENDELQRALEESRRMAREEEERIRRDIKDEEELQKALRISKEEEEARIKALEDANKNALFDDSTNLDAPNAYNGSQLVDTSGGYNPYLQPQYTSFNPYMQQQQTGWNPFLQQQMQQQAQMQAQWQQQQQQQQQWQQQQAAQQYQALMMQQTAQPQRLQPQQTAFGSNNPFANFGGQQQQQQQHNVPVGDLFSSDPTPPPQQQQQQPPPQQQQQPAPTPAPVSNGPPRVRIDQSGKYADLDRMLASGDGIDTFGNTGDMRSECLQRQSIAARKVVLTQRCSHSNLCHSVSSLPRPSPCVSPPTKVGHAAARTMMAQQTGQQAFGGGAQANGGAQRQGGEQPFFSV